MCCFCVHSGAPVLIYPGTSLYEHILWIILEKNRSYACTFPVQREEINVVKVRFTMRYSSRKLSNDKVITTACNFWRQIACSFQVMSGDILFLGKKIFEIPPFFQTRPGDLGKKVHACSLRFSAIIRQKREEQRHLPISATTFYSLSKIYVAILTHWSFLLLLHTFITL